MRSGAATEAGSRMKLCKDCRWIRPRTAIGRAIYPFVTCHHPDLREPGHVDVVTGADGVYAHPYARTARSSDRWCGESARLYEPRYAVESSDTETSPSPSQETYQT